MKFSKFLLTGLLVLPWFSVPFINKKIWRRFWPAALFICLFVRAESYLAEKRSWWRFYESFHPRLMGETPLIWGPFFIGSMWILNWTYGRFFKYMALNTVVDSLFVFPGLFF